MPVLWCGAARHVFLSCVLIFAFPVIQRDERIEMEKRFSAAVDLPSFHVLYDY